MWKPLGNIRSNTSNVLASILFVFGWGWFLYQGVIDPLGGINSLWPIFGIANQLLAVMALAFGTTVLIKMGRVCYLWATLAPLAWLFIVTMSAGWMKIFSLDPRLGFLSAASVLRDKIIAGGEAAQIAEWSRLLFNNQVNVVVTALFMALVLAIVGACAREWFLLLSGAKKPVLHETEYIALAASQ
jgi:carbon starvation protein